jgi:hypothetical protein
VGWLVLLPVILIGSAALASFASVRYSSLRITSDAVEIRNFRQPPKVVPLADVDRFVPAEAFGAFSFLRPPTAVLVLTNGSRVTVRAVHEPKAGYGVEALNERVAALRPKS